MPEIVGGVLIAAFIALYLLFQLLKAIFGSLGGLWNNITGETARGDEARRQFNEELLAGRHPSEEVLALVASAYPHPPLPEAVRERLWYQASTYHEAVVLVREEIQIGEERASSIHDHKVVAEAFAQLVKNCDAPWEELIRLRKAMRGTFDIEPWSFPERVFCSVTDILPIMAEAHGSVPPRLAGLRQAVLAQLRPTAYIALRSCVESLRREHEPLCSPAELRLLRSYDEMAGSDLAHKAALSYWALIVAAGRCCGDSRLTTVIKAQYLVLLKPFLINGSGTGSDEFSGDGNRDRNSAGSHSSSSSGGTSNRNQSVLSRSFEILEVASDATDEEVKSAYRDLTKIWHPDRFSEKDARLREKAAGKFREVQEAYELIKDSRNGCPVPPPRRPPASTDSHSPDEDIDYVKRKIDECRGDIQSFLDSLKAGHASSGDWTEMLQRQDEAARQLRELLARIRRSAPNTALSSFKQKLVILETRTARLRDLNEWASEDEMMALTVLPDGSLVP